MIAAWARSQAEAAAAALIAALPLGWLLSLSGGVAVPAAFLSALLLSFIVLQAGQLVLRAANAQAQPAAAAWVAGAFATGMAVYLLVALTGVLAAEGFALWAVLVLAAAIAYRTRTPQSIDWRGLLGLALCAAVTVMWCREVAAVPQLLARDGQLYAWVDYPIHGAVISQFGDPRAAGRLSLELVDVAPRFYHYASYALAAVYAAPLDLPGLPLATSAWLPLGTLTMYAGAYALGAALAGATGGVAAVAALSVLPDSGSYGLRNSFFSYYWNLVAVPGASFAVGIALLSFAMLGRALEERRSLAGGLLLAGGSFFFRANIGVLALPAWLASAAWWMPWFRRRRLAFFLVSLGAFAAFVFAWYALTDSLPALELFLNQIHIGQEPTAYRGLYRDLLDGHGRAIAVPVGVLLVYVAALGAFVVLYPLSAWLTWRAGRLQPVDVVPPMLLAIYALLMLSAPVAEHGDSTELTHRPFMLLYAAIATWTAAGLVGWLASRSAAIGQRAWAAALVLAASATVVVWPQAPVMAFPKFGWSARFFATTMVDGLPAAAAYLRREGTAGDVFAVSNLTLRWRAIDPATQLAGMTGFPAYIARPRWHVIRGGQPGTIAMERHTALIALWREPDAGAALRALRGRGVRWYVAIGGEGPAWDPERRRAAFVDRDVAVYATR